MTRSWRNTWFGIALVGLMMTAGKGLADVEPPGDMRDRLTVDELIGQQPKPDGPIHNGWFMPVGQEGPAHHPFAGHITLTQTEMGTNPVFVQREVLGGDPVLFPGVTLTFFSDNGVLIPATQDIVRETPGEAETSFWQIIVQPGRVWSETGDDGWSRASFPFALMNELENDTHHGVATFLYDDDRVSDVRYQIVQQTAPYFISDHFHAWGQLAADYAPVGDDAGAAVIEAYRREMADRFPVADWSVLEEKVGEQALENFEGVSDPDYRVISGLVIDGVLYHKPSSTPWGDYPYSRDMRFGVWAITKSVGPTLGMLRLAQKYGPEVFDLRIVDYVTINADHDGWDDVTFGDALDMATGIGGGDTNRDAPMDTDYGSDNYDVWYIQPDAAGKIAEVEKTGNYPWGPGEVARNRDRDMFLLGVAMDAYLKQQEGPDADIWTMIAEEVLKPIGIHHAPMNRTIEPDGSLGVPIMVWGYYPTLDDLAKIAALYHHHGNHDGNELLHPDLTASLFSPEGAYDQQRLDVARTYKMGLHATSFPDPASGEDMFFPFMAGWVGNLVILLPDAMTAIRISNAWPASDRTMAAARDPFPMIQTALGLRGVQVEADASARTTTVVAVAAPGEVRTQLTAEALLTGTGQPVTPIHNGWFMPVGEAGPPLHRFSGTITFHPSPTVWIEADGRYEGTTGGFELSFVSHGDYLIPTNADFIVTDDEEYLTRIIVSPGRVWSEPGDDGLSRASFPFVEAYPQSNAAHNGVATFVFDDDMVSGVQAQVIQETGHGHKYHALARLDATYEPHRIADEEAVIAAFEQDMATRLPVRPFAELEGELSAGGQVTFSGAMHMEPVSASGIVIDDVIYLRPCETEYGDFPYCEDMRHGVFSVTKSIGGLLSMLYLAEQYGDEVFDLRIKDFVAIMADHQGWDTVTFGDVLNMATGVGGAIPDPNSRDFLEEVVDEPNLYAFVDALPATDKLNISFSRPDYPWGPGEVLRYTSLDTFVLAAAMDALVKEREGPDANLWDMVTRDVLHPIGVMTLPMSHTVEPDGGRGIPNLWAGAYPNVHDIAKIAALLHNGGRHGDRQLLSPAKLAEALYRTEARGLNFRGSANHSYHMSLWYARIWVPRCDLEVPSMRGLGGNLVILLPDGMTVFYFADNFLYDVEGLVEAAAEMRSLCPHEGEG